ncbi:MAG: prolyl oligopeptidase family serine peptidase [bacterium]
MSKAPGWWGCPLAALLLLGALCASAASDARRELPSIPDTIRVASWQWLGPFSVGPREGLTGINDRPESLVPSPDARYPSMLAQGGFVRWQPVSPDSTGWIAIKSENVFWDTLASYYGVAGVVSVAYASCELESPAEQRALAAAENVGLFYINGVQYPGDPYRTNSVRVPVTLRKGTNTVLVKLSGYGDPSFKLDLVPAPAPLVMLDDCTTPDILRGERGRFWVGVAVVNTTNATVRRATIGVGDGVAIALSRRTIDNLAPLCVRKFPVEIEVLACPAEAESLEIPIEISPADAAADGGAEAVAFRDTLVLRIREPGESYKRTFISRIDCSCQYYAVLPPTGFDPVAESADSQSYALIFTLHGASVRAEGQADAYKPKSWAFIVAPTNRRPFGFDWQDWGRLDALEVLDEVKAAYPVDPNRVYLTGHSMGGHGVWHVGLAHPDLFAAAGPGAGWTSFELYIPWFLQKSNIFAEPEQIAVRAAALREDATLNFVENAANLPVFIFQGGADDNVPPTHPRMLVTQLDDLGYDYHYKEIPGLGHWWSIDSLGTSCVDDPDLMAFFQPLRRDPCPSHVVFRTSDLGRNDRAYWVRIRRQEAPFSDSRIEATIVEGPGSEAGSELRTIRIKTENVSEFSIMPCGEMLGGGRVVVTIDGYASVLERLPSEPVVFSKRAGGFMLGETRSDGLNKTADLYGPIKQAYFSPFVLVYGTAGAQATTGLLLNQARLESWQWWLRGNGHVEILADSAVTREVMSEYNLILFGGPDENLVTRALNRDLPIRMLGGRLFLGTNPVLEHRVAREREPLAAAFVYPNPLSPEHLVFVHEGVGLEGLKLATFFGTLYSGAGLPDFMIFDDSVRKSGWAGIVAAGFFDSAWKVKRDLTYRKP